ncbi:MAG: hypothetical protein FH753_02030 [Firmicutes bacterium]|nr:hypothetical protein [Bacillota bacterium]
MSPEEGNVYGIIKNSKLKRSNIKKNQYTISLLNEALRVGLLNMQEVCNIQSEIKFLLKDLIMRYTKGESTSVTIETTENLLSSIMYAIDAYTYSFHSLNKAIEHLKKNDMKKIYEKGIELISLCYEETIELYKKISKNKLNVKLEAYNLTIWEAIPLFFKKYEIIFGAHNTMASIDYPLALVVDDIEFRGVFYINKYLKHFNLETKFCKYFNEEDIEKTLENFGKMTKMDYKIELINIFELVFNNAIFSVLSGGKARNINISKYQYEYLNERLTLLNTNEITLLIERGSEILIDTLNISDLDILEYIKEYKKKFLLRVKNAVKNKSLNNLIVTGREEEFKENVYLFKENKRMSNSDFNLTVKKISRCRKTIDKISIIKSNISSLNDMLDIFNAHCLYGKEFKLVFDLLGDMELTILSKIVFYEELRDDNRSFLNIILDSKEAKDEWQIHFIEYLQNLEKNRINFIEKYFSEINYEEISFY